mmetsp:Transcript_59286/g.168586  ORF Transcript_59286/g.168586 Transcript_59286/m.168586 type:complete len:469 (-) Transcript_59286:2-1408(-)
MGSRATSGRTVSGVQVGRGVDLGGHRADVDLEALLDFLQHLGVLVGSRERDRQPLGAKAPRTPHAVEVRVAVLGHVVVDDDVYPLDVDAAPEQVGGNHDALLELLELLVARDAVLLVQPRVDGDRGKVTLHQQLVERDGALHGLHENYHLVELQGVEEVVQLPVLLLLGELHVVLQQPVQRELGLLVHADLVGVLHELLAQRPRLGCHGGAEHHNLFLLRGLDEDLLDVFAHVQLVQALVALVEHELGQLVELQVLLAKKAEDAAGRTDQNLRAGLLEHLLVLANGDAAIDNATLHVREVLGEAVELVLDLVRELTRVADHHSPDDLFTRIDLLQARQDKDRRLAHARLGLAEHIGAEDGLRDALVLHLGRVLEAAVHDGTVQLRLQQEVLEACRVDVGVAALLLVVPLLRLLLGLLLVVLVEVGQLLLAGHGRSPGQRPPRPGRVGGAAPSSSGVREACPRAPRSGS